MNDVSPQNPEETAGDSVAAAGGSYEVLRDRLAEQGRVLADKASQLNEQRKAVFGGAELTVIANERVRTENNCVPAEIISMGDLLLFGYRVHLGLKKNTEVSDVFSLHQFVPTEEGFDLSAVALDGAGGFLTDSNFCRDLAELYQYYKDPSLLQLRTTLDGKLLAVFSVGNTVDDTKVFRWSIDREGKGTYIDNRGERDHVFPPSHDFEWVPTSHADQVQGQYPHISILDELFVETVGGDLTIKIENNTDDGLGIYREPVEEASQSLDDAQIFYAPVGGLILLRILPFREETWRHFVFNTRTKTVLRADQIGRACIQLPEDQGIIFPGGYYLFNGTHKIFDGDVDELVFQQAIKSPNGEDVLYVFLTRTDGNYLLFPYNVIRKAVQNPIRCHGYTLFGDGRLVVFRAVSDEPTRVHPMQVWQTAFTSAEYAASAPRDSSFLAKVGNAELVRGISDAFSMSQLTEEQRLARHVYEDLIAAANRMLDDYYWLDHPEAGQLAPVVRELRQTSELVIDEFEKVQALHQQAAQELAATEEHQRQLVRDLRPEEWRDLDRFMPALTALRHHRGHLIALRDTRFMDLEAIDQLEQEAVASFDRVSEACVQFLLTDEAFGPLEGKLGDLLERIEGVSKSSEAQPLKEELEAVADGLNVLSEIAAGLQVADPTARTTILEGVSGVFSRVNRVRATLDRRRRTLLGDEGRAEFAAQFQLLSQSVESALARADTPEACDHQLAQLMLQLEELESRFSELDEFAADLAAKREEIYEALSARKQTLLEQRQRRADNLFAAANRILDGIARRARTFQNPDDLHTYYSSDPMLIKLRQLVSQLQEAGDSVKADELESRLTSSKQDALRVLRDRTELFEEGASIIKLGRHRFSVNTQPLELTMLPREEGMVFHLTGTDYAQAVQDDSFSGTAELWDQSVVSENGDVYRGEYLAASILFAAEQHQAGLSIDRLQQAALSGPDDDGLVGLVRHIAADRYDEGYERGVHDADGTLILRLLLALRQSAGLLRFPPRERALACLFWAAFDDQQQRERFRRLARSLGRLRGALGFSSAIDALSEELAQHLADFVQGGRLRLGGVDLTLAGRYLVEELARSSSSDSGEKVEPNFTTSAEAMALRDLFVHQLDQQRVRQSFEEDLHSLADEPVEATNLALAWLEASLAVLPEDKRDQLAAHCGETAVLLVTERHLQRQVSSGLARAEVKGLLGQHRRIHHGTLELRLDEFLDRLGRFGRDVIPRYRQYRQLRSALIEEERQRLRLDEFKPRVLTSFVRNKLINEVYLPLIGDNLAKQLGSAGEGKRTDLMGMLLLVSPPGYGKTTLMEYLASQLGLVFMKVNGPALGHGVTSLDPAEAPNATARQEVNKINLALEMGNNVMLYLDDIQHTNPELLQKFISLCDAQRRVEGVWNGRTRTYDLRGKKFCMVMAGNPYTESGERFQIPDMLSNRADTYNLGDILEGKDQHFALSYIENALTSNPTLAPLASRSQQDLYLLLRMAQGQEVPTTELSSAYAAAELSDMVAVLRHLTAVQQVLLQVNAQYIASAAQDDAYRREPPFQLQGSYRNMTKLAEKVVPAMNEEELQRLIDDHYLGEAQTLTSGAEHNLLKLKELRGSLQPDEKERWQEITAAFQRLKRLGGSAEDPAVRAVSQLGDIGECLDGIRQGLHQVTEGHHEASPGEQALNDTLGKLDETLEKLNQPQLQLTLETPLPQAISDMLARQVALVESLVTMVYSTTRTLEQGGAAQVQLMAAVNDLKEMGERLHASAEPREVVSNVTGETTASLSRPGTQPGVPLRSANKDKP